MNQFSHINKILIIFSSMFLTLGFQNCADTASNKAFYTKTSDSVGVNSITDQSRTPAQSNVPSESGDVPSGSSNSSKSKDGESKQVKESGASSSSSAKIETCTDYMNSIGYEAFSMPLQIELNPIDNMNLVGTNPYAYSGFQIAFIGKKPINEIFYRRIFDMSMSGFKVKMTDTVSNNSIKIDNAESSIVYSISDDRPLKKISFNFPSSVYFQNKDTLANVNIELFCGDKRVGGGVQDLRSLAYPLSILYKKVSGGYTFKDSVVGFMNMTCPNDAVAGGQVVCSAGGLGFVRIEWFVNNVYVPEFKNLKKVTFNNVPAGVHTVQAVAYLADGKELRSLINTVRISK